MFGVIRVLPYLDSDYFSEKHVLVICVNSVQTMTDVELLDLIPLHSGSLLLQRDQGISGWVSFQPLSHFILCLNE